MNPLWLAPIGIALGAFVIVILNFRFLLYPLFPNTNPMATAKQVTLEATTLFLSDLHLKAANAFPYSKSIKNVLDARHVRNLVIDGDLFDSPSDAQLILGSKGKVPQILGVDDSRVNMFFVQGSPSHDPPQREEPFKNTSIVSLGLCAIFDFRNLRIVAYHGHDLSFKGAIAHGWNRFVSRLSLERAWKHFARVPDLDWVIFGHSHIPGIDIKGRVANCGGWKTKRFLVRPAHTGLLFTPETGSLEIVRFG